MADNAFSRLVFNNQFVVNRAMKALSLIASGLSLYLLAYYYGYPPTPEREKLALLGFEAVFAVYVLSFLFRLLFTLSRLDFIKSNWFEGLLMVFLLYDIVSLYLFGVPVLQIVFHRLGFENFSFVYMAFVQVYLLFFVGIDAVKLSHYLSRLKLKSSAIFGLSFLFLIAMGTLLLRMPEMTTAPGSMDTLDALFTSVSASCVTGLAVVDTATFFTFKGQLVLLVLFQIGGIGIISFALFFAMFMRSGAGIQGQNTLKEMLNTANLSASRNLLKQVMGLTFLIEAIGAALIYAFIGEVATGTDRVFLSIFHSVSAFCNAGFSIFPNGLLHDLLVQQYYLHMVIAMIIFLGSLGFPAIQDLIGVKALRERMKTPWKDWALGTKISLYTSVILVVVGALLFYGLENQRALLGESYLSMVTHSIFQSVTTRTAGFNTVDFAQLAAPTLIFMILFMFIGASSASTGGGIKTSTFVVIFLSIFSTVRNRKNIEIAGRTLSTDLLNRALSIFLFAASFIFIAVFVLSITDPDKDVLSLLFEAVSAFCTVGLSTGITPQMSIAGKVVLMVSMYLGRVGILTLVVALSSAASGKRYTYPTAHLMIG
jgi:potassium uptake TrkH family protein